MYIVRGSTLIDIAMDIGLAGLFLSCIIGLLAAGAGLTTIALYAMEVLLASCLIALAPLWFIGVAIIVGSIRHVINTLAELSRLNS